MPYDVWLLQKFRATPNKTRTESPDQRVISDEDGFNSNLFVLVEIAGCVRLIFLIEGLKCDEMKRLYLSMLVENSCTVALVRKKLPLQNERVDGD